jgi:hypothetical protein
MVVFWLLAPEGEHFMPDGQQPVTRRVPLREGSVEAALAPHGGAFLPRARGAEHGRGGVLPEGLSPSRGLTPRLRPGRALNSQRRPG